VALPNGDHSEATCRALWERVPKAYRQCRSFSDFWKTSAAVLPEKTHRSVGKETGQTAHMERWNNTLRQRVGASSARPFPSPRKTGGMTE
jgi:insertion element IS1 protein InsB